MKIAAFSLFVMLSATSFAQLSYEGRPIGITKGEEALASPFQFTGRMTANAGLALDSAFYPNYNSSASGMRFSNIRTRFTGNFDAANVSYLLELNWSSALNTDVQLTDIHTQIIDAAIAWELKPNLNLIVGKYLLPGNRERGIYSQNLQFIGRSLASSMFSIDRDFGVQLRYQHQFGKVIIRPALAVTTGEGIHADMNGSGSGYCYTGRLEVLPFGEFADKGEYIQGVVEKDDQLKLALGATGSYNDNAYLSGGQFGQNLGAQRDLKFFSVDFIAKIKGFSLSGDYLYKTTDIPVIFVQDTSGFSKLGSFVIGQAFSAQAGYLFAKTWEAALRFTQTDPYEVTGFAAQRIATVGVTKYMKGNQFKFQINGSAFQYIKTGEMNYAIQAALDLAF